MPLKRHENILVFYRALPRYNPQFWYGERYEQKYHKGSVLYKGQKRLATKSDGKR